MAETLMAENCFLATVSLTLGDYAVIGGMLMVMTTTLLFNLKTLTRRVEVVETRIGQVENDRVEIERHKVDKVEWARETMNARKEIGQLAGGMRRVEGKLDVNFGMSAAITGLTAELAKQRESAGNG